MTRELYGMPIDEARRRLGSDAQAVSIESSTVSNGPSAGTRRIRIVNGALEIDVLPDRGLDLGQVRVDGVPLAWISPTGFPRMDAFAVDGRGWLRAFGGGLLTTCGLLNVGPPADVDDEAFPMHGRYSSLAADVVRADVDDDVILVGGVVREATVFGADLELRRTISSPVGGRSMRVRDRVVNRGAAPVEPMVLYHLNFGWPLVDEGTVLRSAATEVRPRDDDARRGAGTWDVFPGLTHPYPEQVFEHVLPTRRDVEMHVEGLRGLSVTVRFDTAELPGLFQWRVAEPGLTVLGVEPALVPTILGRAAAREQGLLTPLAPGAALELGVEIEVMGALR